MTLCGLPGDGAGVSIAAAQREVEEARAELRDPSPAVMERCAARLERAVSLLATAMSQPGGPGDVSAACQLRRSLGALAKLAARPAAYYAGWQNRLGELTAGYGPDGEPGERQYVRPPRVLISG